eukprot:TRINITY_DN14014_c0_g1_i1.p1 TRINITY_DN14014_c0_g1~~TRINITY_DN14014_c0_g1_i1.p1  ORF type:complete len:255 (-),score=10.72 TRINITY_DN14014_c0_g1_i1:209-973(-)
MSRKEAKNSLGDALTCPICMEYMESPIYQCRNGHTICSECHVRVNDCPQCRVALDKVAPIRTLALEQMVDKMKFKYPCRNSGCKVSTQGGNARKDHRAKCPHRTITCFVSGCGKKIKLPSLYEHVEEDHKKDVTLHAARDSVVIRYTLPKHDSVKDASWTPSIIGDNLVCFMVSSAKRDEISVYCRYIYRQVRYSITVEAYGTMRCYAGWARPIDYHDDEIRLAQYLSVPANAIWFLTDANTDLTVSFVFEVLE